MTQGKEPPRGSNVMRVGLFIVLLCLIGAGVWWFMGRKVWTDDHAVHVLDSQAKLREVIWEPPRAMEEMFGADNHQRYEPSFSPDGSELYFVSGKPGQNADIYVSYRRNNYWTKPQPLAAINTEHDELGPRVTPDGKYLLFYSDRPGGFGGYDIWAAPRTEEGWGKPFNLGSNINSEFNEFTPDATPDGKHLIFATNRTAARREQMQPWRATIRESSSADYDLWIAELTSAESPATQPTNDTSAIPPELAFFPAHEIPGINTSSVEGASCMSPAGDFLYFASNRPGGFGKFDIWRCRVSPDWKFGAVENAGPEVNTADNETDPALTFNGYRLVFSSDRGSDLGVYRLFTSDSREVYALRTSRPIPQLGRNAWLFIASLVLLIPLLLFLRGWDEGRLGTFQKCMLVSVLAHVLLCLGLTFMYVSKDAYHYVRQQMGVEIPISLNASDEVQVATAIRRQSIGDLPTSGAPPSAQRFEQTPIETKIAPGPIETAIPRATAIQAPTLDSASPDRSQPVIQPSLPTAQAIAPSKDASRPEMVDPHIASPRALNQAEAHPQIDVPTSELGKSTIAPPTAREMSVSSPSIPSAQAQAISAPQAPAIAPHLPAQAMTSPAEIRPMTPNAVDDAPKINIAGSTAKLNVADSAPISATIEQKATTSGPLQSTAAEKGPANISLSDISMNMPKASTAPTLAPIEQAAGTGLGSTTKNLIARPTTMPSSAIAEAIEPTGPKIDVAMPTSAPQQMNDAPTAATDAAGPSAQPSSPLAVGTTSPAQGPARVEASIPTHGAGDDAAHSFASSVAVPSPMSQGSVHSSAVNSPAVPAPGIAAALDAPNISLPQTGTPTLASSKPAPAGAGDRAKDVGPSTALSGKQNLHAPEGGGQKNVPIDLPGPMASSVQLPTDRGSGLDPISARPHMTPISSPIMPQIDIGLLPSDIGNTRLSAPDSPFKMRSPEVHRPIIEQLGGSKESEEAVARALAWLADNQEENGRWTTIFDSSRRRRARSEHDTALTALPVLAFLAQDHRPDKPGPYRQTVTRGLDFLLASQRRDGDLRGDMPGPGANQGNMYDHGIAAYAMAEAAIATHDPRYIDAALRAADFIVSAQNEETGGWRYSLKEQGDTSVFGWQVMALHSAERVGFIIPDHTREGIDRYIQLATTGNRRMLASYQPHREATPTMTAQMAFTRMLLGEQFTAPEMNEASDFLSHTPTDRNQPDLYYWYYASLCMDQMHTDAWKSWNERTRDTLISMQIRETEHGSYWDANVRKGAQAGRVFSTSMAALTLEVYYRYAPMQRK